MARKIRIGVVFGGRSGEHEVSLTSARSVLKYLDRERYEVIPIGIDKAGRWLMGEGALPALESRLDTDLLPVSLLPDPTSQKLVSIDEAKISEVIQEELDVIFPVLHGTYGEDGSIQGLFELANIAYVGAGVTASAVAMDKAMTKALLEAHGLPQLPYLVVLRWQWEAQPEEVLARVKEELGFPCFVKPANLGSSVGISKAHDRESLEAAINLACQFDRKLVIEQGAPPSREVECAVLGNDHPKASVLGEIVPDREFYDYAAKYEDSDSQLIIPARISEKATEEVRNLALQVYKAVDCAGMARVDFFVGIEDEKVYVNEINTIPGFTPISMFPKLWEVSGLSYPQLLDRLVELALERHQDKQRNRTSYLD